MGDFAVVLIILACISPFILLIIIKTKNNNIIYKAQKLMQKVSHNKYKTTKQLGNLYIDERKKCWYVYGYNRAYRYSDIVDFEIIQNGTKYKTKNGITRAVVGGLLFGATGAIVGASTAQKESIVDNMSINIRVNDANNPLVSIILISEAVNTSSTTYSNTVRLAQQIVAQLSYMKDNTAKTITVDKNKYSIDTRIAGVRCTNDKGKEIQAILPTLHKNDKLIFVREPQNEYDKNAIKVICDYQHIGYIKSELAEKIAPLMDCGRIPKGIITEITQKNDKSYYCKIHINI